ncbi:MAG: hypothetical protein AB7I04_18540 [Pseudomonadales bacterium]
MSVIMGELLDALEDDLVKRAAGIEDWLVQALTAGGRPYGMEELSGRDLYDHLLELRASGDQAYYGDPRAAETLRALSAIYGEPPPIAPPFSSPFAVQGVA